MRSRAAFYLAESHFILVNSHNRSAFNMNMTVTTQPPPDPPQGWTDDETYMDRAVLWSGEPGDLKHFLNKCYGFSNANPIWVYNPEFGDDLFLFQATPKSGGTLNYMWEGLDQSIYRITRPETLEEIRESIQKLGGRLTGLEVEEITLP